VNRREIAHIRLEAVARAGYPYSLIAISGRDHLAIKAEATVYVARFVPLEIEPWLHRNCTEEVPAINNGTEIFVDHINYVSNLPVACALL
jgi:hypothetical protein